MRGFNGFVISVLGRIVQMGVCLSITTQPLMQKFTIIRAFDGKNKGLRKRGPFFIDTRNKNIRISFYISKKYVYLY